MSAPRLRYRCVSGNKPQRHGFVSQSLLRPEWVYDLSIYTARDPLITRFHLSDGVFSNNHATHPGLDLLAPWNVQVRWRIDTVKDGEQGAFGLCPAPESCMEMVAMGYWDPSAEMGQQTGGEGKKLIS